MEKRLTKEDENSSLMLAVVEKYMFVVVKWWFDGVAISWSIMGSFLHLNALFIVVAVVLLIFSLLQVSPSINLFVMSDKNWNWDHNNAGLYWRKENFLLNIMTKLKWMEMDEWMMAMYQMQWSGMLKLTNEERWISLGKAVKIYTNSVRYAKE